MSLRVDVVVGFTPMVCKDCGDNYQAWTDDSSELFDLCATCARGFETPATPANRECPRCRRMGGECPICGGTGNVTTKTRQAWIRAWKTV